jgi:hypothetical protein
MGIILKTLNDVTFLAKLLSIRQNHWMTYRASYTAFPHCACGRVTDEIDQSRTVLGPRGHPQGYIDKPPLLPTDKNAMEGQR